MLLQVDNVSVAYGAVEALKGVSLSVSGAEIVAVLGANGAGKTTLLKAISGLVPVKSGAILYEGRKLHELPPHLIARMGVVHIPEGRRVFATLTVEENLNLGGYGCPKEGVRRAKERVFPLFPVLAGPARDLAADPRVREAYLGGATYERRRRAKESRATG